MAKSVKEETVIKSVKNFGFDKKLLINQNKNYKTEGDKRAHLNNIENNIRIVRGDLILVWRYIGLVRKKIREIKGGSILVLKKEDLVKEIEQFKNNYLHKWELDSIAEKIKRKSEAKILTIYYDSTEKLIRKFENKKDRFLILESLYEKRKSNFNHEAKIKEFEAEIFEKNEELRSLQIWIRKELEKYENIKLLSKTDEDEISGKDVKNIIGDKNIIKERWTGTKSEFARFVVEEYQKNEQNKYNSLKNATEIIFDKYKFEDKKFTAVRCYDLARKV